MEELGPIELVRRNGDGVTPRLMATAAGSSAFDDFHYIEGMV
jgi:hypothetical protein